MFNNKTLLVTGGTGSFGHAVVRRMLNSDIKEIRIFSRDEKKQDDMRKNFGNEKLKFYLGDVRDSESVAIAVKGADYIFHAAALKQVPSCEFYPLEAVKTNVIGTENVLNNAIMHKVESVVCLSTDKAVYPINAMGITKALMEKIAISKSRTSGSTKICVTRYGNVMGSRGSVIPLFASQIKSGKSLTITEPNMTRFMMTIDDAVDLVLYAFNNSRKGEIYIQKAPAAKIITVVNALKEILNVSDKVKNVIIGTRHGEKQYETLLSREEMAFAEDMGEYFCIKADTRDLNYDKYFNSGEERIKQSQEYNSNNTNILNIEEMKALILKMSNYEFAGE